MPGRPWPDSMNISFSPIGAQQPPKIFTSIANGDGPNPTTRLPHGHQAGPNEKGFHGSASLPSAEEKTKARFLEMLDTVGLVEWQLEISGAHSSPRQRAEAWGLACAQSFSCYFELGSCAALCHRCVRQVLPCGFLCGTCMRPLSIDEETLTPHVGHTCVNARQTTPSLTRNCFPQCCLVHIFPSRVVERTFVRQCGHV